MENAQKRSCPQDSEALAGSQAAERDGVVGAGKSAKTKPLCLEVATPSRAERATMKSMGAPNLSGPDPRSASHTASQLLLFSEKCLSLK